MLHTDGKSQSKFPFKDNKVLFYITVFSYIYIYILSHFIFIHYHHKYCFFYSCIVPGRAPTEGRYFNILFFLLSSHLHQQLKKKERKKNQRRLDIYLMSALHVVSPCTRHGVSMHHTWCDHAPHVVWPCTTCGVTMHHAWCDHAPHMVWPCTTHGVTMHHTWCDHAPHVMSEQWTEKTNLFSNSPINQQDNWMQNPWCQACALISPVCSRKHHHKTCCQSSFNSSNYRRSNKKPAFFKIICCIYSPFLWEVQPRRQQYNNQFRLWLFYELVTGFKHTNG